MAEKYLCTLIFILFRADEKAKKYLFTLCTFFFLRGQKTGMYPYALILFILFRADEKERIKKKTAAQNFHSFENTCHC